MEEGGVRALRAELGEAVAFFSTRLGGVSEPPRAGLNLGILTGDSPAAVRENRRRLAAAVGIEPERVLIGRQVHGAEIAVHTSPQTPSPFAEPGPEPPTVDGHATAEAGLAPLVLVADCLPIALAGPGGIAMLHGGWRGLSGGIIAAGAAAVEAERAAIGPGIGRCCYEVGAEVLEAFAGHDGVAEGRMLDLVAVARAQLEAAGVAEIEASELCTSCHPELFYSHRGEGPQTGRQGGLVRREG